MIKKPGIRGKMLLSFGLIMAITVVSIVVIDTFGLPGLSIGEYEEHRTDILNELTLVADLKKERLERWIEERRDNTTVLSKSKNLTAYLADTHRLIQKNAATVDEGDAFWAEIQKGTAYRELLEYLEILKKAYGVYHTIRIHDGATGTIIFSTDGREVGRHFFNDKWLLSEKNYDGVYIAIEYEKHLNDKGLMEELLDFHTAVSLSEDDIFGNGVEDVVAVLNMHINPDDLIRPMLHTGKGMGRTGEALLIDGQGIILTSLKHPLADGTRPEPLQYRIDAEPAKLAAMGQEGIIEADDYRGVPVIAALRHIQIAPGAGWGMVVKIDRKEVFEPFVKRVTSNSIIAAVSIFGAFIFISFMSGSLTRPILKLKKGMEIVGRGDLDYRLTIDTHDEIGDLSRSFDRMTGNLKEVTASRDDLDREIAERRRAEVMLQQHVKALEAAYDELSQYAYVVSHDLKAPLRAIHNYSDFIREDMGEGLDSELKGHLDGLAVSVNNMETLISDLLEYSKLGQKQIVFEDVDMGEFFADLVKVLAFDERDVIIKTGGGWPVIVSEPVMLKQVFQNLITNAVKFNKSSPKVVELGHSAVGDGAYEFFVRDNGIGIEPRFNEQIFRVFERLHTTGEHEGTGIGLAIVKKAATRLGGTVGLESTPGQGSTFTVILPGDQKGE